MNVVKLYQVVLMVMCVSLQAVLYASANQSEIAREQTDFYASQQSKTLYKQTFIASEDTVFVRRTPRIVSGTPVYTNLEFCEIKPGNIHNVHSQNATENTRLITSAGQSRNSYNQSSSTQSMEASCCLMLICCCCCLGAHN